MFYFSTISSLMSISSHLNMPFSHYTLDLSISFFNFNDSAFVFYDITGRKYHVSKFITLNIFPWLLCTSGISCTNHCLYVDRIFAFSGERFVNTIRRNYHWHEMYATLGISKVTNGLKSHPKPSHCRNHFFHVYGHDPNLPLHQLLEPMQHFLGDPNSGLLNLEPHCHCKEDPRWKLSSNCTKDHK